MEDILASIKKVIAEEKELRSAIQPVDPVEAEELPEETAEADEEDVLELDESLAIGPPMDLGPPLLDESAADTTRQKLEQLSTVAANAPSPPAINPLEEVVRDMLRPVLKDWLDEHLPRIVEEHVRREISRITGRKL